MRGPVTAQPAKPPAPDQTAYVSFSAEVVAGTTEGLIAALSNLVNQGARRICLMLSTPGGSVMHGLNLYNVLRGLPVELTTHNVGNVDSIGTAVFLAGRHRFAAPHSTFTFHGVGFDTQAPARFEEKTLRERLDSIQADQRRIGQIIEERTRLDEKAVSRLFLEAQTRDAAYALDCGIVEAIRDLAIPAGSPIVPLVFQR